MLFGLVEAMKISNGRRLFLHKNYVIEISISWLAIKIKLVFKNEANFIKSAQIVLTNIFGRLLIVRIQVQ